MSKAREFIDQWIGQNVHNNPLVVEDADFDEEIEGLIDDLVEAGTSAGLSRAELEDAVGDFNDHVTKHWQAVQDPELGFKD